MASDVIINVTVTNGGTIDADLENATIIEATVENGGELAAEVQGGGRGEKGDQGDAATIEVGTTTTLAPGSPATVTNVGSSSAAEFNFGIPEGERGETGDPGEGVPTGGTLGQVLIKLSGADFDTDWHTLVKSDVGLGNADNTSDANKPVSTAQAAAIAVVQADINSHESNTSNPHSVTKSQVGLANADNTSDANKPISSATQTALDGKVAGPASVTDDLPAVFDGTTGKLIKSKAYSAFKTLLSLVKGDVGLSNVDNTSDVNKPISTATQAALDLKEDIADLGDLAYKDTATEADITLADNTTNNFSTTKHGFVPKGPNTGKFLKDDGTWDSIPGGGDMLASTYDPQAIGADAFDVDNHTNGTTNKVFTAVEKTKLSGIESGADVTDTANVDAAGALMESEVDADIKTLALPANTTISAYGKTLVDDADASAARTTLGLVIGTNVQAWDADLDTIASLTPTTDNFMVATSGAWASRTPTQARSQMGLGSIALLSTITEANITLADNTTNNVTTSAHGFVVKAPNDASKFFRGDATWAIPSSPQADLINGKITTAVASNNLTVAIKTLAGNDPSASDPVYVRIGNTLRTITGALSVTKNAGTNWFAAGSPELATFEIDYFVYLGYNATDGVVLGFARIPYGRVYSDFNTTSTNERYCAISTITTAASTDEYENIGRFNAILSATASFNWSLPATSIIISRPIFETRRLTYDPTWTGFSSVPANNATYIISGRNLQFMLDSGNGTSNATTTTITLPMTSAIQNYFFLLGRDSGTLASRVLDVASGTSPVSYYATAALGTWTNSGNKSMNGANFTYPLV